MSNANNGMHEKHTCVNIHKKYTVVAVSVTCFSYMFHVVTFMFAFVKLGDSGEREMQLLQAGKTKNESEQQQEQ